MDFLFLFLYVFGGAFIASMAVGLTGKILSLENDPLVIVSTLGAHLGMLGGVGLFAASPHGRSERASSATTGVFRSGVATFLMATPLVYLAGIIWGGLLYLLGLPLERQLAVDIFVRVKSIPWLLVFAGTAVAIAPTTEEFVFRWGMFRFLRTRAPRWVVLVLPACLFATLHVDLPTYGQLAVLGIVFALAYERTGHIGTAIVAHALFNLNMLLLLLAGIDS
jgi:uncharacterized protein